MIEELFDISAKDFEKKLRHNESMPLDSSAIKEDLAFLDDFFFLNFKDFTN